MAHFPLRRRRWSWRVRRDIRQLHSPEPASAAGQVATLRCREAGRGSVRRLQPDGAAAAGSGLAPLGLWRMRLRGCGLPGKHRRGQLRGLPLRPGRAGHGAGPVAGPQRGERHARGAQAHPRLRGSDHARQAGHGARRPGPAGGHEVPGRLLGEGAGAAGQARHLRAPRAPRGAAAPGPAVPRPGLRRDLRLHVIAGRGVAVPLRRRADGGQGPAVAHLPHRGVLRREREAQRRQLHVPGRRPRPHRGQLRPQPHAQRGPRRARRQEGLPVVALRKLQGLPGGRWLPAAEAAPRPREPLDALRRDGGLPAPPAQQVRGRPSRGPAAGRLGRGLPLLARRPRRGVLVPLVLAHEPGRGGRERSAGVLREVADAYARAALRQARRGLWA
mmetsp:Transcript_69269/g.206245  ORF Transcript_69269/g.206245 Transcript_69269/m.206245 type:complete len:387 (+) Transcript_69269:219-1379(+)